MHRTLIALTVVLALPALADADKDARAVAEAFVAAANIKDPTEAVKKVVELFADDAQHIGVFGHLKGKADFLKTLPGPFSAPNRTNELLSQEASELAPGVLLSISHFKNSFSTPDGKTVTLNLRCVRVLKKQKDGRYLIASEHTSVGVPPPPAPPAKTN